MKRWLNQGSSTLLSQKQLCSILSTGPNIQRKKHTAAWETRTELKYKNIPCTTTSGLLSVECLRFRGSISPRAIKFCLEKKPEVSVPCKYCNHQLVIKGRTVLVRATICCCAKHSTRIGVAFARGYFFIVFKLQNNRKLQQSNATAIRVCCK